MSWTFAPAFDAGQRAALQAGKNLVYVAPPAGWAVRPLFEQLPAAAPSGLGTLVLAPEPAVAAATARLLATVDALVPAGAAGLDRAARLLAAGSLRTLVADAPQVLHLVERARLDLTSLGRVVLLWPELHAALDHEQALDTILADARGAGRVVATEDPDGIGPFLERHARRAPVVPAARPPAAPTGAARFAVVEEARVEAAVRAVLDGLDPASAFVWDPTPSRAGLAHALAFDPTVSVAADGVAAQVAVAIATDLPSADALAGLRGVAHEVVLLIRPWQTASLARLVAKPSAFPLPSATADAQETHRRWRAEVRARLHAGTPTTNLLALAPLFDEFDPALVAAALLGSGPAASAGAAEEAAFPTWAHLRLSVGTRDRVRTGDVVGALLNAVGLAKHHIGRVDVRDSYTIVEVRSDVAEAARQGVEGTVLRGRAVAARFDQR